jgi:hypothetical protein
MPVNLIEIQKSLSNFAEQAKDHFEREESYLRELKAVLTNYAEKLDEIRRVIGQAADGDSRLRCALPTEEAINQAFPVGPMPERVALLAADGSQINPSRHARVPFCVINIGAVEMRRGSGKTPKVYQKSQLLDYDRTTLPDTGIISEGRVALERDLAERQKLAEWSAGLPGPALAMIDGPLEIYRDVQQTTAFERIEGDFKEVLEKFKKNNVFLLGYVDKPGSDLLVSLLEIIGRQDKVLSPEFPPSRPVRVVDTALFGDVLKNPGDRSAVFSVSSPTSDNFGYDQQVHFFFMNVGFKDFKHLVRVEIPEWVTREKDNISLIQSALLDQTKIMGTKPYPYLLHRSHEVAMVSMVEHQRVEDMIINELYRKDVPVGEKSQKQAAKDL